jgi:AcrR family transcriptional regulator
MTQTEQRTETKEHILTVSLELFACFGFDGTSVRKISEKAGVNVAAINYHFGSKHNLYWAAMSHTHNFLRDEMARKSEQAESVEDLIVLIYDFIVNENSHMFRSTIKMMLSEGIPDPDPEYFDPCCTQGPPGMETVATKLSSDLGKSIDDKQMNFAVRAIFGVLMHWCLLSTSSKMNLLSKNNIAPLSMDEIRCEIRQTIKVIKKSLV